MKKETISKLKGSLLIGFIGFFLNLFINLFILIDTQKSLLTKLAVTLPTSFGVLIVWFVVAFISISAYQYFYNQK